MLSPPAAATHIHGSCTDRQLTISIRGRFDFNSHKAFRRAYADLEGADQVIIDLGQTDYLDSAALGMLLVLKEAAGKRPIRIVACRPAVQRILKIANFDQIFPMAA